MRIDPNVIEQVERFNLDREQIEDLIRHGFNTGYFLDGRPGTSQSVDFSFDLGHSPRATVTVKTLVQPYRENKS